MQTTRRLVFVLGATSALSYLAFATPPPVSPSGPHHAAIFQAAGGYRAWGLVSPEPDPAPADCAAPSSLVPPTLSDGESKPNGHGGKLYYLFAKDPFAYRAAAGLYRSWGSHGDKVPDADGLQPVGQIIVKESWTDVIRGVGNEPRAPEGRAPMAVTGCRIDGVVHEIGERSALFMMLKVGDEKMVGTDRGWVYATLTPDGKTVTSAGLVSACMACHAKAKQDRVFGPKQEPVQ